MDWWFVAFGSYDVLTTLARAGLAPGAAALTVELHQLANVKFGLLQDLDLADEDVVEGEDTLA